MKEHEHWASTWQGINYWYSSKHNKNINSSASWICQTIDDFITKATELERMCRLYEAGVNWDNQQKDGNAEVEIIIESNGGE